jgi:hypothetical protein
VVGVVGAVPLLLLAWRGLLAGSVGILLGVVGCRGRCHTQYVPADNARSLPLLAWTVRCGRAHSLPHSLRLAVRPPSTLTQMALLAHRLQAAAPAQPTAWPQQRRCRFAQLRRSAPSGPAVAPAPLHHSRPCHVSSYAGGFQSACLSAY